MRRCWPAGARASSARARTWAGAAPGVVARRHAGGVSLALAAPADQLFVATEVNEWALCATLAAADPALHRRARGGAARGAARGCRRGRAGARRRCWRRRAALARLARLAAREARPALHGAARRRRGARAAARARRRHAHPRGGQRRARLSARRAAAARRRCRGASCTTCRPRIVTGSNGKTTTVRLLAACARAHGWPSAFCCTDGVFFDGQRAGQRRLLRTGGRAPRAARARARRRRSSRPPAAASCAGDSRSRARTWRSSPTSAPIISASTASTTWRGLADVKLTVAGVADRRRACWC